MTTGHEKDRRYIDKRIRQAARWGQDKLLVYQHKLRRMTSKAAAGYIQEQYPELEVSTGYNYDDGHYTFAMGLSKLSVPPTLWRKIIRLFAASI